jgi:hypothetical protein
MSGGNPQDMVLWEYTSSTYPHSMSSSSDHPANTIFSDSEISYVVDNERDAERLCRQTGSPVAVRRWILKEYVYRPSPAPRQGTSRYPRRPRRLHA